MGKCVSFLKWIVFAFNVILWLLGLAVLGIGIFLRVDATITPFLEGTDNLQRFQIATYVLMAVGSLMAIIGFVGFCGAQRESRCLLATFFGLLLVVFIGEIAVGAIAYFKRDQLSRTAIENGFAHIVRQEYGKLGFDSRTRMYDVLQAEMECCGAKSFSDWFGSSYGGGSGDYGSNGTKDFMVPASCCRRQQGSDSRCGTSDGAGVPLNMMNDSTDMINETGCATKLLDFLERHKNIFIGALVAVAVLQVMALIFAIILCCTLKPQEYGYKN